MGVKNETPRIASVPLLGLHTRNLLFLTKFKYYVPCSQKNRSYSHLLQKKMGTNTLEDGLVISSNVEYEQINDPAVPWLGILPTEILVRLYQKICAQECSRQITHAHSGLWLTWSALPLTQQCDHRQIISCSVSVPHFPHL